MLRVEIDAMIARYADRLAGARLYKKRGSLFG
jgi:hypothetical protein